jgi:hypothetical protein
MIKSSSVFSVTFLFVILAGLFFLAGCSQTSSVDVEIVYRNHPPVREVLVDVDKLLTPYGEQLTVTRYDMDTPEGEAFLKDKGITDPKVLVILVNGTVAFQKGDQEIQFISFPVGKGTAMTEAGNWTLDDLSAALAAATSSK